MLTWLHIVDHFITESGMCLWHCDSTLIFSHGINACILTECVVAKCIASGCWLSDDDDYCWMTVDVVTSISLPFSLTVIIERMSQVTCVTSDFHLTSHFPEFIQVMPDVQK